MRIRLLAIIPAVVLLSAFQDGAAVTSPWVGNRAVTNTAQQPAFIKDEHLKPLVGARVSHPFANQMPKLRVVGAAQANAVIPAVDLSNAFITRPYLGQHIATSIFDHCNPDYSVDGRICDSDGFVALSSNGVDPSFSPEGPTPNGTPYALVVGTLQPRKDPEAAIEALALLGDDDLRLVFAGPDKGGRADAERAAERSGLSRRVEFRGHVPQEELAALYRGAACLVFPSRYEGFGLPALEAMATGTPVVATTAGALPEVAGDAAILVEERNPAALAGGIERALADRERLVRAGLARAKRYSWAETARRTLDVYRELL